MLYAVEALTMNTLFLQRPDYKFDHAVLLRAVGRDKLLLDTIAFHQGRVFSACEDQALV